MVAPHTPRSSSGDYFQSVDPPWAPMGGVLVEIYVFQTFVLIFHGKSALWRHCECFKNDPHSQPI